MPPKLVSEDGRHVVIRPLAYVREAELARYAELREFPLIPCDLCGSQENLKRQEVKTMLHEWEQRFPGCLDSMFASLSNVLPEHLLDQRLYDVVSLQSAHHTNGEGDPWLDEEDSKVDPTDNGQPITLLKSTDRGLRAGFG